MAIICTILLAIGSYIIYKSRETKGQQAAVPIPSTIKAELLTPEEIQGQIQQQGQKMSPQLFYFEPQPVPVNQQRPQYVQQPRQYAEQGYNELKSYPQKKTESKFLRYTSDGYVSPIKEEKTSGTLMWK